MKPKLLLRLAAGCILFHIAGHLMGHSTWREGNDPVRQEVIRQMTEYKFPFMGVSRSMGDYFEGYSWNMTFTLIMILLILWITSSSATALPSLSVKILVPVLLCLLAFAIADYIYFFPLVAITCLMAAVLIGISILQIRKQGG